MSTYGKQPGQEGYDPIVDLQISLGGRDEHNAILRVVTCLLAKIEKAAHPTKIDMSRITPL